MTLPHTSHAESNEGENPSPTATIDSATQTGPSIWVSRPPIWMEEYHTDQDLFNEDEVGFAMYSSRDDPITYEEACEDEKWVKAIEVEIATIDKNQT